MTALLPVLLLPLLGIMDTGAVSKVDTNADINVDSADRVNYCQKQT